MMLPQNLDYATQVQIGHNPFFNHVNCAHISFPTYNDNTSMPAPLKWVDFRNAADLMTETIRSE